jgi:hypothetical protein
LRASTTGITYHPKNGANVLIKGENNLGTSTEVSSGNSVSIDAPSGPAVKVADCDPTGQYMMTRALAGARAKSSDFGATWGTMGSLPVGNYCFGYAGPGDGTHRFIAAGAVVRYTPDFGTTWENWENSELTAINAFPALNLIKVLEY